jgi:hypothetical protein
MSFADNSDRAWMTPEEWEQLGEMPWLEAFIMIGDIDLAEAIGRYEKAVERVEARIRTVKRDRMRRAQEFDELRASLPSGGR